MKSGFMKYFLGLVLGISGAQAGPIPKVDLAEVKSAYLKSSRDMRNRTTFELWAEVEYGDACLVPNIQVAEPKTAGVGIRDYRLLTGMTEFKDCKAEFTPVTEKIFIDAFFHGPEGIPRGITINGMAAELRR